MGTSDFIPFSSAEINSSASAAVLAADKLTLMVQSASFGSSPKAVNAWLVFSDLDEHAEPLETQMPFPERK